MLVRMVKMFALGVEVERRMLNDRYTPTHRGKLVIMDVTDQGKHRPVKAARILSAYGPPCELYDVPYSGPLKAALPSQAMSGYRTRTAKQSATNGPGCA